MKLFLLTIALMMPMATPFTTISSPSTSFTTMRTSSTATSSMRLFNDKQTGETKEELDEAKVKLEVGAGERSE